MGGRFITGGNSNFDFIESYPPAVGEEKEGILYIDPNSGEQYTWDGTNFITDETVWKLNGNAISNSGMFLGTTNNEDLHFKTNNQNRLLITKDGNVGIDTALSNSAFIVRSGNVEKIRLYSDTLRRLYFRDTINFYFNANGHLIANESTIEMGLGTNPTINLRGNINNGYYPAINLYSINNALSGWVKGYGGNFLIGGGDAVWIHNNGASGNRAGITVKGDNQIQIGNHLISMSSLDKFQVNDGGANFIIPTGSTFKIVRDTSSNPRFLYDSVNDKFDFRGVVDISADDYGRLTFIPTSGNGNTAEIWQNTTSPRSGGNLRLKVTGYVNDSRLFFNTAGIDRMTINGTGKIFIHTAPTTITTATKMLVRDTNGEVKEQAISSGGGASFSGIPEVIPKFNISGNNIEDSCIVDSGDTVLVGWEFDSVDTSAKLQIGVNKENPQGFLPPRLSGSEIASISSPAAGLMVYCANGNDVQINDIGIWVYSGADWKKLTW